MERKIWSKTILQAYNYINRICNVIDKHVVEKSSMSHLNSYGYDDTILLTESIIDLIERKRNLLELKYLVEDAVAFLDDDLRKAAVLCFFDRRTANEIADMLNISSRTVNRLLDKVAKKCYVYFEKCGYNVEKLNRTYACEPWLIGMYNVNASRAHQPLKKTKLNPKVKFNIKSVNMFYDGVGI